VTVSSPGSGDGKSFVASNLALAFADAGHRTLLLDGDIRRGGLHRVMNADRKPGLTDFLAGKATREQLLRTTSYPNLSFIACGTRTQSGPELLGGATMRELIAGLRAQFAVIIVDSPPLGAGVDPFVLGTLTGNLLLVLRTGVTDREMAEAKLDVLDRLPIRVLGAVLNDVREGGSYRYYSYSYYIAGYEAADEEPDGKEKGKKKLGKGVAVS
jgi:capsular exopolysaccharide synthesis family protein